MERRFEIVVIGGGVAGLTASLFAARRGRSVMCVMGLMPGGQLANIEHIEDFPGFPQGVPGYDLGPGMQEQASAAGAEFMMSDASAIEPRAGEWHVTTDEGVVIGRAVIFAAGSSTRPLGVPGEARLAGKGVSHCASCDGPMLAGKPVVVVGAGDSGLQEALALARFASQVNVFERAGQVAGQSSFRARVEAEPKIRLRVGATVEEILGVDGVTGVRVRDAQSGADEEVPAHAVFVYGGLQPNTAVLERLVELDARGRVPTDAWMRTSRPGLYAAGDVRADSAGQAISSAGDGATAAIAAHRDLA